MSRHRLSPATHGSHTGPVMPGLNGSPRHVTGSRRNCGRPLPKVTPVSVPHLVAWVAAPMACQPRATTPYTSPDFIQQAASTTDNTPAAVRDTADELQCFLKFVLSIASIIVGVLVLAIGTHGGRPNFIIEMPYFDVGVVLMAIGLYGVFHYGFDLYDLRISDGELTGHHGRQLD